jgi:hypothetical protein
LLGHISPFPFVNIPLSESFGLFDHSVKFINKKIIGSESNIMSSKPGPKPMVLGCYPLEKRVTDGKMCVSNIHQFKGSKRNLVILFGINASYVKYSGRNLPDNICPN